jgi:hypothetical protein
MENRKFFDDLVAPTPVPSRGEFAPVAGKPVCSIVVVDDVEPEDSYGIFERAVYSGGPPPGRLARIVAHRERKVISFTAWETLEAGRDFFENVVGAEVAQLAIENEVRRDLTRNEFRLLSAITGRGAADLVINGPGPPGGSAIYLMRVRFLTGDGAQPDMQEAVDRLVSVSRSRRLEELRETNLLLEIGCVTADGVLVAYLFSDPDVATGFFERTVPEIAAESFGDWSNSTYEIERYETMRATIAESILVD